MWWVLLLLDTGVLLDFQLVGGTKENARSGTVGARMFDAESPSGSQSKGAVDSESKGAVDSEDGV